MNLSNLNKRLITSLFLIILLFLALKYSVIFISTILIVFVLTWIEFNNLLMKINIKKKIFLKIYQIIILSYLFFFIKIITDEYLQYYPGLNINLIFVIIICILSDVGGFIFGKTFKGKKLTKISPNKTYSGSIGSFFLSSLFSIIYSHFFYDNLALKLVFLSFAISFICQMGDLFISFIKRKAKVKDTGNFLPGHGGLLDRIDGILFALPFGILLINIF